jgi:MioC protein
LPQPIRLLVGTMTGTAELVAQEVEETLRRLGFVPTVLAMDHLQPDVFDDGGIFLIVSSTYGNGDVPDNAQAFFASLQQAEPDLSGVIYGVIALGDMTYKATFCNGGLQFDRLLSRLGARRVGEPLRHDASGGALAEDVACDWTQGWVEDELAPALAA